MAKKTRKLSRNVYEKHHANKDKGGARQGYIDWRKFANEISFFEPREGVNKINIIPFEVKNKNHPLVRLGEMKVGEIDFMLDIWVHKYIGPTDADVLCPKFTYGKACPICEESRKYRQEGKKDEANDLKATRRVLMNVIPIVKGELGDLQVFDVSHWLFMKELLEEAFEGADGDDSIPFADIEEGSVVKFRMTLEQLNKRDVPKFKSFDFLDREEELKDSLIDDAVSFDEGLIVLSPDDLEKVLYGADENGGDEEEEKEEETEKEEKDEKSKDKNKDEEEEEEDEKEVKKKSEKGKCPEGHKWGQADDHKECKNCDVWEDCVDAQ